MPFSRQRRAVPHCRTASPLKAGPQSETLFSQIAPVTSAVPAVSGFRYLLRRLPLTLSVAAAILALPLCSDSQARSAKKPAQSKTKPSKPTGVWAWTSGSQTYMRARPGVQTPPVGKVPRHTKLFVWGKYNGWYRVETPDGKFGWIHNEYLNSPDLEKAPELSHFKAKQASDRTANQVMYGSVEMLKKHYERYGSLGAKKGLAEMGVVLKDKPAAKPAPKIAAKPVIKPVAKVVAKPVAKPAPKVAAKPVATPAKTAAKIAQSERPQAETSEKPEVKVETPKAETPKVEIPKPETPAVMSAPPVPQGRPLSPAMPNPTVMAPAETKTIESKPVAKPEPKTPQFLAPAIPMPPRGVPKSARKGNPAMRLPQITPEELLKAREEHLKQKGAAPASGGVIFVPSAFSRHSLPAAQFAPQTKEKPPLAFDLLYARSTPVGHVAAHGDMPESTPAPAAKEAPKVLLAKNPVAKKVTAAPAPAAKAPAAKASAPAAPHRGGSPRDFARLAKAPFGAGLANSALAYRGRPYVRGSASPSRGFDCSGLVYYLLRQRGYNPPRTAAGLASYGKPVPAGQLQPGDLVLFSNTYKRGVSHVGIYMGNNKFVHAATSPRGVRVDSLSSAYYCRKYYGARRVQ